MRKFLVALLSLIAAPAFAQSPPTFTSGQGLTAAALNQAFSSVCPLAGCTLTGPLTGTSGSFPSGLTSTPISGSTGAFTTLSASGAASLTGGGTFGGNWLGALNLTNGLKQNGTTILTLGTATSNPVVFGGGAGGSSNLATDTWMTGFGVGALGVAGGDLEDTAFGNGACAHVTTASFTTCIGVYAVHSETTGPLNTGTGEDDQRNTIGGYGNTSDGANALRNGAPVTNTVSGVYTVNANSGSVTLGGTPTAGDVVSVAFASTNGSVSGVPATANYTVQSGDTLTDIAAGLVTSINALSISYQGTNLSAAVSTFTGGPPTIGIDFIGTSTTGAAVTMTFSATGSATETATIGTGFAGVNNAVFGAYSMYGLGSTAANNNALFGAHIAPWATTLSSGAAVGEGAARSATSDTEFALLGQGAGASMQGTTGNSFVGYEAGGSATGSFNSALGAQDIAYGCITTGTGNLEVGADACVPSSTADWQLSIQNIIYGTGNSGTGSTVSTGSIGIGTKSPGARLNIVGIDRNTGVYALDVQNSALTHLLRVGDDGAISAASGFGVSATGTVIANDMQAASGGIVSIVNAPGYPDLSVSGAGTIANYLSIIGATSGGDATLEWTGSDSTVNAQLKNSSTVGTFKFVNGTGNMQFGVVNAAGSVSYIQATGAASGDPSISAGGTAANVLLGSGTALATNATTGFVRLPGMAGASMGTIANVSAGAPAVWIDTTNKKICYEAVGGTPECSAAFAP